MPDENQQAVILEQIKGDYPDCYSTAKLSLQCATEHHKCPSDACATINNLLKFCFVFSHCPKEAEDFANCVQKFKKPVNMETHPAGCTYVFSKLDECMTKQTEQ